jgi:hypothetical protein
MGETMDTQKILSLVDAFMRDSRMYIILGLIIANFVLGVAHSLKDGTFEWAKVADFYTKQILPYLMAYLTLYVIIGMIAELNNIIGQGATTAAFGVIVVSLVGSIWDHLTGIGITMPNKPLE